MADHTDAVLPSQDECDLWLRHTSGNTGAPDSPATKVRRLIRFIGAGRIKTYNPATHRLVAK